MVLSSLVSGAVIDMAKKVVFEKGKKIGHDFLESATGKKMGSIICYRKSNQNNNVLLFVHGFSGSAEETFGAIPDMLETDPQFAGWDIFSIGYSTDVFPAIGKGIWSVNPDITKISQNLRTLVNNQFGDYKRLAFVSHSMGGLATQRCMLDLAEDVKKKISHVLFFGTPSAGLRKAAWFKFWNRQIRDLGDDSEFIKLLRSDWSRQFGEAMNFKFKSVAGSKDEFVPVLSSLQPFAEQYREVIEGNHVSMIKPGNAKDVHNEAFGIILKTLTAQSIVLRGDPEEVNLLLGEYSEVIRKYGNNAKELTQPNLLKLAFALECTGDSKQAMQVLLDHAAANKLTDTMGVIGGRFKRMFLQSGLQSDLDKAVDYYQQALTISVEKNDKAQVYYHAINLAFLYLVGFNDRVKMKAYAQQALDNCDTATNDFWELGTIAEANLYLGNTGIAETFYKQAAAHPGADARTKVSMHSNAYNGYQALNGHGSNDTAFLKMLDEIFL